MRTTRFSLEHKRFSLDSEWYQFHGDSEWYQFHDDVQQRQTSLTADRSA